MPEPLSEEGARELRAAIARLSFQFAKTMPEAPHEYVVRTPENEADFTRLYRAVEDHGIYGYWGKRRYRYLYPGDGWRYWIMGPKYRFIINRARAAGDHEVVLERARDAGHLKE